MDLTFRNAREQDLGDLVRLLANDKLGKTREDTSSPINAAYLKAFQHINSDANNELIIAELAGEMVAMLQLTFIPYLTHIGSWRCLIEGVRVDSRYRGQGIGRSFFEWAIARAKGKGCSMVQLTSDKKRPNAIKFYEDLGFVASHEGFKLKLD